MINDQNILKETTTLLKERNIIKEENISINKYSNLKIIEEINSGLSSKLYLALNDLNEKVIIKIFNRKSREAFIKERAFFKKKHKFNHIINVYDYGYIDDTNDNNFGHYYLIMEYAEKGDLVNFIEKNNLNEKEAKSILKQILDGYEEIYKSGFIHRDLKPENILIMKDNNLKITDFGFCEKINNISSEIIGTVGYMAPEIYRKKNLIPQKIDIFSIGVILFILISRQFPFETPEENDEFYKYIIKEDWENYWKLVDTDNIFSKDLKELIQGLICFNPEKRLNIGEIKENKWFNNENEN